jgi:hypothetical protein
LSLKKFRVRASPPQPHIYEFKRLINNYLYMINQQGMDTLLNLHANIGEDVSGKAIK